MKSSKSPLPDSRLLCHMAGMVVSADGGHWKRTRGQQRERSEILGDPGIRWWALQRASDARNEEAEMPRRGKNQTMEFLDGSRIEAGVGTKAPGWRVGQLTEQKIEGITGAHSRSWW